MAHTYTQNLIHLVFSTKGRIPLIPAHRQQDLWRYIVGIGAHENIHIIAAGGMHDHLHVLFDLPKTMPLMKATQIIKANSSRWMRQQDRRFSWQESYGAFGVSESAREAVMEYIDNQATHHAKRTFEDEYVVLLKKHRVEYDPAHLFG